MIKIQTLEIAGFAPALHGMRNPKNSWYLADSIHDEGADNFIDFTIGENDMRLAMSLAAAGPVHAKYRRMIVVYADILAPLYWWKEYDTLKVGTVANSCSTMHKIHDKEFTEDDFSCEHLISEKWSEADNYSGAKPMDVLRETIRSLNESRMNYLFCKAQGDTARQKMFWWQMIQSLPSTYNQMRTVMLNYEVLANICKYRAGHKLDEWHTFIDWAKSLPYSNLFTE